MFGYVKIPLSDVGSVCMCKRIMKAQTAVSGAVPFYKIGTFGKTADAFISKELFDEYNQNWNLKYLVAINLMPADNPARVLLAAFLAV